MKKTSLVIILQFVLMVLFLVYALVQRTQAIKTYEMAIINENLAKKAQMEAMEQRNIAEKHQRMAVVQAEMAQKALEECQSKK
jgi:hypothetical protein